MDSSNGFPNGGGAEAVGNGAGAGNGKAVQALQRSFAEVQMILEKNRMLIQEITQNHESLEAGGLSRNVSLIRELNSNIARVVDLYTALSCSFSSSLNNGSPSSAAAAPAPSASDASKGAAYKRPRPTQ